MFPKFLRVVPAGVVDKPVMINESTVIYVKSVPTTDAWQLNVLAEALGISYKVVFASDGDGYGVRLPNGSFTGGFGMLQRGEADLMIGSMNMNEETCEYFSCSYPHSFSDVTFMTWKPEQVTSTAVFLHPFSIRVWLSLIACICLVPLVFHYLLRRKDSMFKTFTSVLGSLVGQGMDLIPERLRDYFVLGTWFLGSALLYYFYAAVLLSFVTFPSLHGIRTIEDLANGIKARKYQCNMHPSASYAESFSASPGPSVQEIGKNLQESEGTTEFLQLLQTPADNKKPVYIGIRRQFLGYKEFYFISEDSFLPVALVFVMRKGFCCVTEVDKAVHRVRASGIFEKFHAITDHWALRYYLHLNGKDLRDPPSDSPLTLTVLKGPFIFLILSHSLSFLVFLIEVCIGKFKTVNRFKKRRFLK